MRKRTLAILIFSLLLCGCNFGQGNNNVTETTAETSETTADTTVSETEAEVTETTSDTAVVTEAVIEIDDAALEEQRESLEGLIRITASQGEVDIYDIEDSVLVPLDEDGRAGLAAKCGGKYWFTDGLYANELRSSAYGMKLDREQLCGRIIVKITTENGRYSYRYAVSDGDVREMAVSGKVGDITSLGNGTYTAVCHDYDKSPDSAEHTWKSYWFYSEDGELKEYTGEKITKADLMKYTGGKAVLDGIEAKGGEVTDILYRKNDIVNVNYTIIENDVLCNKFFTYDVSGGECSEVSSSYEGVSNNYGVYLSSVLAPYSEEQLALHELIENSAEGEDGYEILNPIFGDLDGDGKNEVIAVYGERIENSLVSGGAGGELWFASGNIAYRLEPSFSWLSPRKIVSAGQTLVSIDYVYNGGTGGVGSAGVSFLIKSSTADAIEGPHPSGLAPDGRYGDLTGYVISKDYGYEEAFDGQQNWFGRTWKPYWFYFLDDKISGYYGKEITTEDFLKYDGAENILKSITDKDMEVRSILKRGNGIININYSAKKELIGEEGYGESFDNITVRYRNGRVYTMILGGGQGGIYTPAYDENDKTGQSEFEKFSEMIYDTAEGKSISVILERFFGDTNEDGKSELYAYYGTPDDYSLWYADENGAVQSDKDYELLTLDGDIVLKKPRSEEKKEFTDYYIMRDGKTRRVNAYGAKRMTPVDGNDFIGYITADDALSSGGHETEKEYWFYYRNGAFNQYGARYITEEELLEYKGTRAFLDELSSMGGDLKEIILRENGIININYDAHTQEAVQHYYFTLKLDDKDRAEDITPRNEDGTLNNKGYYLLTLK
ncbi:MAG: hypothetical protein J1F11_06700 [Oscillospiraceae bacterium]|nr:hypothetical protein [Oscillospiraceae bacterium]